MKFPQNNFESKWLNHEADSDIIEKGIEVAQDESSLLIQNQLEVENNNPNSIKIEANKKIINKAEIKDRVFKEILIKEAINVFIDELRKENFSEEEIDKLAVMFYEVKDKSYLSAILAIPWSLRQLFYKRIKDEEKTADNFFNNLVKICDISLSGSKGHELPMLAFHNSKQDVLPIKSSNRLKPHTSWEIIGKELDKDGIPRAFAYDGHHGIYLEKSGFRNLYLVRVGDPQKNLFRDKLGHYKDSAFSIVAKLDLTKVLNDFNDAYEEAINYRDDDPSSPKNMAA